MNRIRIISLLAFLIVLSGCTTDEPTKRDESKSANLKTLGTSSTDLLSDEKFTSLSLEIVYVTGYQPDSRTISNLTSFLASRVHKPDGITVSMRQAASSGKAPFGINEIAAIEAAERTDYNVGDNIAVFIYFADGSHENDTNSKVVLGSAYRNTSMVIYGETVKKIAARSSNISKSTVESTVVNHEFGHLFGLVNFGSTLQTAHEDSESKGHCSVNGCLMNANLEFGANLADFVDNNNVPTLDNACIFDLQANGGK